MGKHWTAVCVGLVGVLFGAAGWLTWSILSSEDQPDSVASEQSGGEDGRTESSVEVASPVTADEGCDAKRAGASTELPVEMLDTDWELWRGLVVASSPDHGPFEFSDNGDVSSCFARTPVGALLAAHDLSMRVALPTDIEVSAKAMTMPGTAQDRLISLLLDRGVVESMQGTPGLCRPAGFVFVDYTEDRATIEFASTCPSGLKAETSVVAWDGEDWKLVLAPDGEQAHTQHQIFSLDAYIEWKAI